MLSSGGGAALAIARQVVKKAKSIRIFHETVNSFHVSMNGTPKKKKKKKETRRVLESF